MGLPDRSNPYHFDDFLRWRERLDYYADDPFLQRVARRVAGPRFEQVDAAARALSRKASTRWRDQADASAAPEQRPRLIHWDGHHHRVDQLVRPAGLELMEREVFSEGLFSASTDVPTRLVKLFLVYQNGEACIACPLVCTEGMVAALDRLADRPETLAIRDHVKEGAGGRFAIGAQFLTEIQGGSDVPANRVEAVAAGDGWRLHGTKFFCSVAHADYALVTAKPRGSEAVGLFVTPLWAPGEAGRRRNGLTLDRLKWKLGTSELPTAEITFDGAEAWALGPLDRGLANVVTLVLTPSRLTVGLASAAYLTRAVREAVGYAHLRQAFGRRLEEFPMVQGQLEALVLAAQRATAGAFEVARRFHLAGGLSPAADPDAATRRRVLEARELVMLQKVVAAEDATLGIREAMGLLGGNGVIEDFSCLPRLFRDSAVNELWEGPRNVLLAQVHRDLQRAAGWYPPEALVAGLLDGVEPALVAPLAREVAELVAHESLLTRDAATVAACRRWEAACRRLVHLFQESARVAVEGGGAPGA